MKQYIVDFLKYLENKENKKVPLVAKLLYPNKFGSLTKEYLNIEGDLNLSFTKIQSLPDNLKVGGDLYLYDSSNIKSLPDNLTVGGDLDLTLSLLESLPNNLKVGGHLFIYDTPLARRMTREEIRQEIEQKGGYVKEYIYI
jgi:hypothetical protein